MTPAPRFSTARRYVFQPPFTVLSEVLLPFVRLATTMVPGLLQQGPRRETVYGYKFVLLRIELDVNTLINIIPSETNLGKWRRSPLVFCNTAGGR